MSAAKILCLSSLVTFLAVASVRGDSIHSSRSASHRPARPVIETPTTLVFASRPTPPLISQNLTHEVAAQNLAVTSPSSDPQPFNNAVTASTQQNAVSGLFLGVTGGNSNGSQTPSASSSNVAGNTLGVVLNTPASSGFMPAPASAITASAVSTSPTPADAFINFGTGPYSEASSLTSGTPQAFTNSPAFTHLFGAAGPSPTDVANFEHEVLATIQATYIKAGLPINLTSDPNSPAAHTISVVSGASYVGNPGAIGITDVGRDGFSFIDKFAAAQSPDQLAIAIGHNISHELMHAFGIANHPEQVGPYVDAASSTLQTLSDPNTAFSPAAASLLSTLNFQTVGQSVTAGAQTIDGAQMLVSNPSTVPEPSTVALWVVAGGLFLFHRRKTA